MGSFPQMDSFCQYNRKGHRVKSWTPVSWCEKKILSVSCSLLSWLCGIQALILKGYSLETRW